MTPHTSVLEGPQFRTSLSAQFEQVVKLYPDKTAVKAGNVAISYRALNQTANRLARAIVAAMGQGSEPVALLFPNDADLIAALLGTLKAGKFFVSIDPSFPISRINYILKDSEARLLITNHENYALAGKLLNYQGSVLDVEEVSGSVCDENMDRPITSNQMATLVYTSGSTGDPKGVINTQSYSLERALFNIQFLSVSAEDRLSLLHSISFASGEISLYASLLSGASLLPFDVKCEGTPGLIEWLAREKITVLHCAPSLLREIVELHPRRNDLEALRLLHLSGAPILRSDFEKYKNWFPPTTLLAFHMGATETGCMASAVVDRSFMYPQKGTPAGFTRESKRILILDEVQQPVPIGEIGEIAVQSRYLAEGYWRNPELTAGKFLSSDFSDERTYLTGDLGHLRADGFLIHLGRKDHMVKIRGYRVELEEVEKACLAHPAVAEAAVVAWEREAGEKFLVAYLALRQSQGLPVNELASFLKTHLPEFMIPTTYVYMERLPSINGKPDRRALPRPENKRPLLSMPYRPPTNEIEKSLARIWSEVLAIDPVGVLDDFLSLGGHSLAASRVVVRIQLEFGQEIPMRMIFESRNIARLAQLIVNTGAESRRDAKGNDLLREIESLSEAEAAEAESVETVQNVTRR